MHRQLCHGVTHVTVFYVPRQEDEMSKYLSCAETAKLIRQALQEAFPGSRFSVKSSVYSMGASITVRWIDGPNAAQVESITRIFEGSYFDSMIDYKGSRYHKLDGAEVRFGSDSVRAVREFSDVTIERAIKMAAAKYGAPIVSVDDYRRGEAWRLMDGNYTRLVRELLTKISDRVSIENSATIGRIKPAGDDGYGAGTVGRDGEGGNQCYAAMAAARERQERAQSRVTSGNLLSDLMLLAAEPVGGVQ
jgi:hypothetical protein